MGARLIPRGAGSRIVATLAGLLIGSCVAATEGGPGAIAEACGSDRDCSGYARCLEGLCAIPPAVLGRGNGQTPTVELTAGDLSHGRFFVELAEDRFAQARGLSHRPSMAQGWGMLFVFPETVQHTFTMALMRFPLDLLFVAADGKVVHIIEGAQPKVRALTSPRPYRYVLELNAGTVRSQGIRVGDRMRAIGIPGADTSHPFE